MRKSVGTFALWLLTAALHAAPLPGFVLAVETPHVSFYSRGQKVDARRIEQRVSELEQLFGQRLSSRARYYQYATAQEIAAGTGYYAEGVTFPATAEVHSTEPCPDHELVHLVAGQLGDPGRFFAEGLAVAVGNRGQWQGRAVDRTAKQASIALPALVADFDRIDPAVAYPVAGSFVGYLIRVHGMARVTAFFHACGPGADRASAFTQAFGGTLESQVAGWRTAL